MREKVEGREWIKASVKKRLLKETNGRCAHCGKILIKGENQTLEHFIPLNKGGRNEEENFTMLCYDCNQFKSDMILPVSWYEYLPKEKKHVFGNLIRKYLKEVDYLAQNCVLMLDILRIRVFVPIQQKLGSNGYKTVGMPVNIEAIRMTQYDAFDWLMKYRLSLELRDAHGTISEPKEWPAPCYLLKKSTKDIAMVCPHIEHIWDEDIGNYVNSIIFDWFFSPELSDKESTHKMLADIVKAMEMQVMTELADSTKEGAFCIGVRTRCFVSDKFSTPVFDKLNRVSGITEFSTGYKETTRVRELVTFQYAGHPEEVKQLQKETAEKIEAACQKDGIIGGIKIAMQHCEPFNKRFERS